MSPRAWLEAAASSLELLLDAVLGVGADLSRLDGEWRIRFGAAQG